MKTMELEVPAEAEDGETQIQTILVDGLDEFIPLLSHWHKKQVAIIRHLMDVPPGVEVDIEGATPFKLEGENLQAFRMALELSLHYLGELPFAAEYEPEETTH
jgi:hypothetical protein